MGLQEEERENTTYMLAKLLAGLGVPGTVLCSQLSSGPASSCLASITTSFPVEATGLGHLYFVLLDKLSWAFLYCWAILLSLLLGEKVLS